MSSRRRSTRGVLPGVTRAFVLRALVGNSRPAHERPLSPAELAGASEAFLTSSLIGVRPLRRLDGKPLPAPTPVADGLAAAYERLG